MDSIIKSLLLSLIVLSAVPIGLLICKYTREEIKKGKLELKLLMIASAIIFIASSLVAFSGQSIAKVASGFVFLLALTSLVKSKKRYKFSLL